MKKTCTKPPFQSWTGRCMYRTIFTFSNSRSKTWWNLHFKVGMADVYIVNICLIGISCVSTESDMVLFLSCSHFGCSMQLQPQVDWTGFLLRDRLEQWLCWDVCRKAPPPVVLVVYTKIWEPWCIQVYLATELGDFVGQLMFQIFHTPNIWDI